MKAAVCYEYNKPLVVEEINIDSPKQGEVKVKLAATAVCHSDIHFFKGEIPGQLPFVGGHESSGYVEEIGKGVTGLKPGDPVVIIADGLLRQVLLLLDGSQSSVQRRLAS